MNKNHSPSPPPNPHFTIFQPLHPYATHPKQYTLTTLFLSNTYMRMNKKNQGTQHRYNKLCPECKGNTYKEDPVHQEITCRECGLVLVAPYTYGQVFPGYLYHPRERKIHVRIVSPFANLNRRLLIRYQF